MRTLIITTILAITIVIVALFTPAKIVIRQAHAGDDNEHFYCIMSLKPLLQANDNLKATSWDRPLTYNASKQVANFPIGKNPYFKKENDVIAGSHFETVVHQGFSRDIFQVYRLNLKTNIMVHSYIYYLSEEDFKKNWLDYAHYQDRFRNAHHLFKLVQFPNRSGYVKLGWDKSFWQCTPVHSKIEHLLNTIKSIFTAILSAG